MNITSAQTTRTTGFLGSRWTQLTLGLICMMASSALLAIAVLKPVRGRYLHANARLH